MSARVIDLSFLTTAQGVIIQGDAAEDQAGYSVSNAGDVNGDGYDDVIVGAPYGDNGGGNSGEAYVIFGKANGLANIDLTSLTLTDGFIIQGDTGGDNAGQSVSGAGDVNGDGIDDLIVGAPGGDDGGGQAGEAYVIFGKSSGIANIDLSSLTLTDGFIIQGDVANDQAGHSVAAAGDVNGDGIDDVIVGAYGSDDGGSNAGEAYVIFGKSSGITNIDLSTLTLTDGFAIQGRAASDSAGWSVSSAGDVNGDGIDDVVIGALNGDIGGINAGEAYVIFGKSSGIANIDLACLSLSDGFLIHGDNAGDQAGISVSGAGDVNGDGYDDVIVGAFFGDDGGPNAGEAYVIFGKSGGFSHIDLTGLSPSVGIIIQGDASTDFAGYSVSAAGDVNGDGIDDVIVGAYSGDDGGVHSGEAYVVFGKASGISHIDLSTLTAADGFIIQGDAAGDGAGHGVSGAGDVNGDGFDDVIVGALWGADGGTDAGEAYVIYGGSATGFASEVDMSSLAPPYGVSILNSGAASSVYLGRAVSGIGDVNGDGIDDVIVAEPYSTNGLSQNGAAYVIFGKAGGFSGDIDVDGLTATDGFKLIGEGAFDRLGDYASATGAGDVNGDGIDDFVIGARLWDEDGASSAEGAGYVIYGKTSGHGTIDLDTLTQTDGFAIYGNDISGAFASDVAGAGDFNGDGIDDVMFASPNLPGPDGANQGKTYVVFGVAGTRANTDVASLAPGSFIEITGDAAIDYSGHGVAHAGDVNGDGIDDIIIGALGANGAQNDSGAAYVIFGKSSGLADIDLGSLSSSDGFKINGEFSGDQFGFDVAGGGDVNGDGLDDVVVGARYNDENGTFSGAAYIVYGRSTPVSTIAAGSLTASEGFIVYGGATQDYAGLAIAIVGDMNGDGLSEVLVTAHGQDDSAVGAGAAYVIYGSTTGPGTVNLDDLSPAVGFAMNGEYGGDNFGIAAAAASDVNGDGLADIMIGANLNDDIAASSGKAYIVYGRGPSSPVDRSGSADPNTLLGSPFGDILNGLGGEDDLQGGDGDDTLDGGDDDDRVL
ncbi:FG-GAP repeat protein, partial [Maritimibacter alkaliphilus HTCC2654]